MSDDNISPTRSVAPVVDMPGVAAPTGPEVAPTPRGTTSGWRRITVGTHGFLALLLVIVAAALSGFAVNGYGLNLATARLSAIFLVVFLLVNYTAGLLKWAISRRRSVRSRLVVRPIHLLLLVAVILFTQLIGAEPVLVFGLLLAVDRPDTAEAMSTKRDVRLGGIAVLVGAGWVSLLGVAGAAAHAYVAANPFAELVRWNEIEATRAQELATAVDLATILGLELSAAVLVTTIGSLPLLLLPMWTFEGRLLWEWSRVTWVIVYLVALTAAGLLIAPAISEGSWWLWAAPFIVYAVIALVLFFVVRGRGRAQMQPPQPTGSEPAA